MTIAGNTYLILNGRMGLYAAVADTINSIQGKRNSIADAKPVNTMNQ